MSGQMPKRTPEEFEREMEALLDMIKRRLACDRLKKQRKLATQREDKN